jgi:hypothetical protein
MQRDKGLKICGFPSAKTQAEKARLKLKTHHNTLNDDEHFLANSGLAKIEL